MPKNKTGSTAGGAGFSMIELLVIIAILAILFIILLLTMNKQVPRSRDAQRKADLEKIKVSFEDYYNDNSCYPPADVLENCHSSEFAPYLHQIPCDPMTGDPYIYVPLSSDACKGYRVLTGLETADDPVIEKLACDGPDGCGYGPDYNYGVAVGVPVYDPDGYPILPPSPLPSVSPVVSAQPSPSGPTIYVYACDSAGTCNQFEQGHPALASCPITFQQTNCNSQCANPAMRCNF